uniref:Uncharacterized protein n=1 Tax=Vitis vinifera TaxID=29760 RepID=A5BQ25_VITVI|nr:hypothetical protein VITISV_002411 [Vitis vinifera]
MAIPSSSSQTENFSKHRAPFFTGTDYPYWKARMTWFLQSTDLDVWDVIEDGPTFPTKLVDGFLVPKPKKEWNELDRRNFQLNAKAVFTLQCAMDRNEYNRICQCKSAKEIWRLLEITHEGTNQVKESKINILVHNYELFSMKETETIVEMITRFTEIVNGLESLGRVINESEKVMKILRSLPSKWHTKVTAIQEAKDLTKLPMEELLGSLMTYEISLTKQLQESEDKKKKSIALKATDYYQKVLFCRPNYNGINFVDTLTCQATKSRVIKWRRCRGRCYFTVNISAGEMEIPHEDQSSHYDHEKDKFAYLSMRDRIELGKRQVQQSQWGSKYALNEDMSMKAKLASMARRIEEFELRNVHTEVQPQAMPTSFEYINHPNLATQPQPQPSMSTSSLEQAILKISKVMEDFVGEQQKINSHLNEKIDNLESSINMIKGYLNPLKHPLLPGKRRETNSLGPNGKDANFVWDPGGIQHEVGVYDACKNRNGGETEETGEPKCISKALSGISHHEHTQCEFFAPVTSAWCEKEFLYILGRPFS